ncbi:hypothetical protein GQ457_08G016030 [Hibiscus cannabinus]
MCAKKYYMNLHVGGRFVRDPYLRYVDETELKIEEDHDTISYFELCRMIQEDFSFNTVQIIYFYVPNSKSLYDGLRVVCNDNNTINMINYWYKYSEIELYVEHKIHNLEIIEDGALLLNEKGVKGAGQEAESVGQVEIEGVMQGIDQWTKGASQRTIEGVIQGIDQGDAGGSDKGIKRTGHKVDDKGSEGYKRDDVDDLYFVKVKYLSDGNDDEELQAGRENLRKSNEKSVINFEESRGDLKRSEMNVQEDVAFEEEHEKEEEDDAYCANMRSMFSVYNPNHVNPEFCIGMLFKDGKEFKDAIRKYSKLSRRELKIVRNEPKRIRVKCLASAKCPWRIFASYSRATRCIQVKSFQDEHNCCVSFQNKMVNVVFIADHFEETIRDHPKMKLKEIQRRVALEINVNVNLTGCKRAKKESMKDYLETSRKSLLCYGIMQLS